MTPYVQNSNNNEGNRHMDAFEKLGASRISRFWDISIVTYRKCLPDLVTYYCQKVTTLSQSMVEETAVILESLLNTDHAQQNLAPVR